MGDRFFDLHGKRHKRAMSRRRRADGALSFPRYLQRMQVLTMYRQVLRSTYKIEVCPRCNAGLRRHRDAWLLGMHFRPAPATSLQRSAFCDARHRASIGAFPRRLDDFSAHLPSSARPCQIGLTRLLGSPHQARLAPPSACFTWCAGEVSGLPAPISVSGCSSTESCQPLAPAPLG